MDRIGTGKATATTRNMQNTVGQSFCHDLQQGATYFCPLPRYCEWDYYGSSEKDLFEKALNYDEDSWNYADSVNTQIEMTAFGDLTQEQSDALVRIGFDEDQHDCCHSHYEISDWSDFLDSDSDGVRAAWESLGYDQIQWDGDVITEFADYYWDELSEEQKSLLTEELCYTRDLWNGLYPIPDWGKTAIIPGSSEKFDPPDLNFEPKCREIDPSATYFCPVERYCEWNTYMNATLDYLTDALGYDENSWNFDNSINDEIERRSYFDINSDFANAIRALGFSAQSHDCCQLHYEIYEWSDFSGGSPYDEIRAALELIGYNEELWDNGVITQAADQFWDDLTDEQQAAMSDKLCYTREVWNEMPMQDWPEDAILPGTRINTSDLTVATTSPTPSKSTTLSPTETLSESPSVTSTESVTTTPTIFSLKVSTNTSSGVLTSLPTHIPTNKTTALPSTEPTTVQSTNPTFAPTSMPTGMSSFTPTVFKSASPSNTITSGPSETISIQPTATESTSPTNENSLFPSISASNKPTLVDPQNISIDAVVIDETMTSSAAAIFSVTPVFNMFVCSTVFALICLSFME